MSDAMLNEQVEATKGKMVMNQIPADIVGESPLHHADLETLASRGQGQGGVHLKEKSLQGLLILRAKPDEAQLAEIESVLGVALPTTPLTSEEKAGEKGDISVRWVSPDEWFIVVPATAAFQLENDFQTSVSGHYSLVNVSGGYTILQLSGDNVVDVLKKSTPIDVHPSVFPIGKVVSSVFAKSGAMMLRRTGDNAFELIIRRSFADYIWLWLQDASMEYGLVIEA